MSRGRKIIFFITGILILAIILFAFRGPILRQWVILKIKPAQGFDEIPVPPGPDYALPEHWAALPDTKDMADVLPSTEITDGQADAHVDVFFIHPTTHYTGRGWNQSLTDKEVIKRTDMEPIRRQASVFNSSCRVYAPRYRQATLYSFWVIKGDGKKALDIAYLDIKASFEYFLKNYNRGRPFILASHSQGTYHARKLLQEYVTGSPLRKRLVAAYIIGMEITTDYLSSVPDIPVCGLPNQTRCLITWNAEGPEPQTSLVKNSSSVCVNPLTWRDNDDSAGRKKNLGGLIFYKKDKPPSPDVGVVGAVCIDGVLKITKPNAEGYDYMPFGKDNYHFYDYNLFYMNIRYNVKERVAAYLR